jgi:hypothetical protein
MVSSFLTQEPITIKPIIATPKRIIFFISLV